MIQNKGYTHYHGPEVNTRAAVSQKVRIFSFDSSSDTPSFQQIGVMSSFSVSEGRSIEETRGIGFGDRIAELVPGVTSATSISVNRIALWLSNIMQAFGYKSGVEGIVRSLRHHRWPFDIRQEMVFSEINKEPSILSVKDAHASVTTAGTNGDLGSEVNTTFDSTRTALITFYEGCWMESYGVSFDANSAVITENCSIKVSDVTAGAQTAGADYFNEESLKDFAFRVKP